MLSSKLRGQFSLTTLTKLAFLFSLFLTQNTKAASFQPIPPGWYINSDPPVIYEGPEQNSELKVTWEGSYIYPYPAGVPLYWYARAKYLNTGSQTLSFHCAERDDPSLAKEYMRGKSGDLGYVAADETYCSHNPNLTYSLKPGESYITWSIFHNVPWADQGGERGQVSLEWGRFGASPWIYPWSSHVSPNEIVPSPPICPPEFETLGICKDKFMNVISDISSGQPWVGYAATGTENSPIKFNRVSASWTVQPIDCGLIYTSKVAFWVGLGGINAPLEQIGTLSWCDELGITYHTGVWEIIIDTRKGLHQISPLARPVWPNDKMRASVVDMSNLFGKGKYQLTLQNITRGWAWAEIKEGSIEENALQTAECMVEEPPMDERTENFSNFGIFTFNNCKADDKSLLTYPNIYKFILTRGENIMAELSEINSNGDFSVTWKHE
jgi:hypothetical protein